MQDGAASGIQRRRSQRIAKKQMTNESNRWGAVVSRQSLFERACKRRSEIHTASAEGSVADGLPAGSNCANVGKTSANDRRSLASIWNSLAQKNGGNGVVEVESPTPQSFRDVSASATRSSGYFSLVGSASCSSSLQAAATATIRDCNPTNFPSGTQLAERDVPSRSRASVSSVSTTVSSGDVVDGCVCPPAGLLSLAIASTDVNRNTCTRLPLASIGEPNEDSMMDAPCSEKDRPISETSECPAAFRAFIQYANESNASPAGDLTMTWRALRELDAARGNTRRSLLTAPATLLAQRCAILTALNEVAAREHVLRETYHLAVEYLDRYIASLRPAERVQLAAEPQRLKLLGASCLFVASKLEEIFPPKVEHLANDLLLNTTDILNGEILVCTRLGWCLEPIATPFRWLILFANCYATFSRIQKACSNISNANHQVLEARKQCSELLLSVQLDRGMLVEMCAILDAAILEGASLQFTASQLAAGILSFYCGDLLTASTGYTRVQLADCISFLLPLAYAAFFAKTDRLSLLPAIAPSARRMSLPMMQHQQQSIGVTVADLLNEFDLQKVASDGETHLEKTMAMRHATVEFGAKCPSQSGSSMVIPVRVLNVRIDVRASCLFSPDEAHLIHICVAPKTLVCESHRIRSLLVQATAQRRNHELERMKMERKPMVVSSYCEAEAAADDTVGRLKVRVEMNPVRSRKRNSLGQPSQAMLVAAAAISEACTSAKRSKLQSTTEASVAPASRRRRSCKPKLPV